MGGSIEARVVGVAESPTGGAIGEDPTPFVFLSMDQIPTIISRGFVTLAVRTGARPSTVLPAVQTAFRAELPGLSPSVIATMDDQVGAALMPQRLGSMLLTAFGGLALVLAGVGIYGVVGYNVARQSREIGIRIAIGSSSAGILRTVVLGMAAPVLAGLAIGVGGAIALGRSVAAFMYQVNPADPVALAAVAAVLLWVALIATLIPARRAARTDPVRVLSAE
jgi:ABC-type antimicrobial peptide transport system permease subunit